jgi:hypothetical protein
MMDSLKIAASLTYCARMLGQSDGKYDAENHSLWMWYHAGLYALRVMLSDQVHDDMRARFNEGMRVASPLIQPGICN